MIFNEIIGHDRIKSQISVAIDSGRFSHASIISGEDGIGKSILAQYTAISILGKSEIKQYVDIVEFKPLKGKKSIGIDEIKKILDETNKKPYEGDKKIIILYESDKMTEAAQNAFLKTIEEPPRGVFIILICENLESILDTIKSRCQIYKLSRLNQDEMKIYLKSKYANLSDDDIKAIVAFSDGVPGRGEKFIEDPYLRKLRDTIIDLLKEVNNSNLEDMFKYGAFFLESKDDWRETLTCILAYIRDIMVYKETGSKDLIINIDKLESIKELAEMFSFNKLNGIINIVKDTRNKLERNVNSALVFDAMLTKMQEV